MSKILITGGTGFLAEELIKRLYPEKIRIVARNEGKLVEMKQKYPEIEIITGNIADKWIAKRAMKDVDVVYHLAASKNVEIAEKQVYACVDSNIIGTTNLLLESLTEKPEVFLFISTDKAAKVNGIYGASKLIGEGLMREAELINQDTAYRTVRYGNVIGSTGSFLTKWKPKMEKGEEILLTDPNMTRFFWTREEAVDHIFDCIDKSKDATPYVPEMKGISMGQVLEACQDKWGKCPVKIIGNRGGENMHETMGVKDEKGNLIYSNTCEQMSKQEFSNNFLNSV